MSRFINRGRFGVPGNRVVLLESRNSGTLFAGYYEKPTGKRVTRSLKTTDPNEAKKIIGDIIEQQRVCKPNTAGEILYVIQRGEDGPIKIGISRNFKKRIQTLQNGSAEKLKVLRIYKMMDVERAVHAELEKRSRFEGEWFAADLLPSVDRFFNVPTDIAFRRAQKQYKAETAKVEDMYQAGLF